MLVTWLVQYFLLLLYRSLEQGAGYVIEWRHIGLLGLHLANIEKIYHQTLLYTPSSRKEGDSHRDLIS